MVSGSATLWTRAARKCVCICVTFPTTMNNLKIQLLEFFKPSCELTFWLLEVSKPGDGTMISLKGKFPSNQVRAKVRGKDNDSKKLSAGDAVLTFWLAKHSAAICNDSFSTFIINLCQDCSNAIVACVSVQKKLFVEVGKNQDRRC